MEDFEEKLNLLDKEKLIDFLNKLTKPCYETELLKIAFQNNEVLNVDSLTLYQNHFLLFYLLYQLQNEFYKEEKYLHVHFMRTILLKYPIKGKCRYFIENSSSFCNNDTDSDKNYCQRHLKQIDNEIENLSIKYFYLDKENYYKLDKDTAEEFINGAWEILFNYEEYKKSFEILELPESSDMETIKKQFKILAKKYHPDHGEITHNKFNEINRAYRFLLKINKIK